MRLRQSRTQAAQAELVLLVSAVNQKTASFAVPPEAGRRCLVEQALCTERRRNLQPHTTEEPVFANYYSNA